MHKPVITRKKGKQASVQTPINRTAPASLASIGLIQVERAVGDIRAGLPILLHGDEAAALVMSAETATISRVQEAMAITGRQAPLLLLTAERAKALKIRQYTPGVVAIELPRESVHVLRACAVSDPSRDLANPMRGPFLARRQPLPGASVEAIAAMKIANLLPSALLWSLESRKADKLAKRFDLLNLETRAVSNYRQRAVADLQIIAQASLPLTNAPNTRILAFRPPSGAREHSALLIGAPSPDKPPLVRIHSECFTRDLLGSLKCDCGDQLRGAIKQMGEDSHGGVLLYLAQEGRGIGLTNKLRAYDLQDQGFDTIDANTRLGFEPDERKFEIASEILKRLGFRSIRLLTNNPNKVAALKSQGISVTKRVAHSFPANPHNEGYLRTKSRKSGHLL